MAILIQQKRNGLNWFAIAVTTFAVAFVVFGIYYLFFAPTPGIEIVVPTTLDTASRITSVQVDPSAVLNSRPFRLLRVYTGLPSVGQTGRSNPFQSF
jgi:hypothetical protein